MDSVDSLEAQHQTSPALPQYAPPATRAITKLSAMDVVAEHFGFAGEELSGPQTRVRFRAPGFVCEPVILFTAELVQFADKIGVFVALQRDEPAERWMPTLGLNHASDMEGT